MAKKFNYRGTCIPEKHFMVDTKTKIEKALFYIEEGEYITIHNPRQFGKSTTIFMLERRLPREGYTLISLDFQGLGDDSFSSEETFARTFTELCADRLEELDNEEAAGFLRKNGEGVKSLKDLSRLITKFAKSTGNKAVLIIDEVDASCNNNLFLRFLGMLRDKYFRRNKGQDFSFFSVILAGVHDIKSLKMKIREGRETKYNSPWNIALNLPVALSFSPEEIATMLMSYSEDKNITMDIPAISERLYYYTSGYPFLVSRLCYIVDDEIMKENGWSLAHVDEAFKAILKEDNTNFDSLIKNLENDPPLYNLVFDLIIEGEEKVFNRHNPVIKWGLIHGIFKKQEGPLEIHNKIYREIIYNYMSSKIETSMSMRGFNAGSGFVTPDGSLDLELVLLKFQSFMKEQYSRQDRDFLERNGRLIFLAFIKPILNGKGFDFKEVQVSEEKRLDVVITYGPYKYIVELKIWKGDKAHEEGIKQLTDYLERQESGKGFLLIFNFNKNEEWKQDRISSEGKDIFAVWV